MAVSIGSLILDLRASTDGLSKDAAKAVQKARRMGNDMAKAVAVGAAGAVTALSLVVEKTSEKIDKLAKTADKLGVPIEKLQALQRLGEQSGVGIEATTGAIKNLQNQVFLAAAGSEKAAYGFRALNLNVDELLKLSPDQQLLKVADALSGIENQTVKAGIATKLFGDAGQDMLGMLKEGSKGLQETQEKLRAVGVELNRIDAAKVEIANDAISDLKLVWEGFTNQLTVQLAPIIAGIGKAMLSAAGQTHGFAEQIASVIDGLEYLAGKAGDAGRGWQIIFQALKGDFYWFLQQLKQVGLGMNVVSEGIRMVVGGIGLQFVILGQQIVIALEKALKSSAGIIDAFANQALIPINAVIEGLNKIAGTSIKPVTLTLSSVDWDAKISAAEAKLNELYAVGAGGSAMFDNAKDAYNSFMQSVDDGTDEWGRLIDEADAKFDSLLAQPLPSESIHAWLKEVRDAAQQAATDIAETVKPAFEPVVVPQLDDKSKKRLKHIRNAIWDDVFNPWEEGYKAIQENISGLVRGTVSWKDALVDVAQTFVTTVIQSMVQMAAQWLATQTATMLGVAAIQKTTEAAGTASSLASAAAMEAAWIPAAIAASIATYGAAAWAGLGSFAAATALGTAAAVGIGAIGSIANTAITGKSAYDSGGKLSGKRAQGGHVNAGSLYQVNEKGTELFRPDVSGEVVPLGDFEKDMQPASSAGMMFQFTQTFASGVTRSELAASAEMMKRETIVAITDLIGRGGSYRRAVQR